MEFRRVLFRSGHDEQDPGSIDRPGTDYDARITGDVTDLVIGVNEDYFFDKIDAPIEQSVRAAIQALVEQGAKEIGRASCRERVYSTVYREYQKREYEMAT